jgi:signal transduction histidine kinase
VKVATRITVATTVVVALASAAYAFFDLRTRAADRRVALDREARALSASLRSSIEGPSLRWPTDATIRDLYRSTGWHVTAIPRARATDPLASEDFSLPQLRRLRTMLDVPQLVYGDTEGDQYLYAVPLHSRDDPQIAGMLEVSHSADTLDTSADDLWRAAALVTLIVLVTTLVVGLLARRLVSRPITKLLRGIDDVAKGDLSHVILSERDDEIGAIATRFNDMTFSLRESRAETERQNDEKLTLEQRLGQTEKLATIGQLAAEIAHEVGTPLNVIAGRARSIHRKARENPEAVEKNATIVAEQTARITKIIQRLLDFTRRKVGHTSTHGVVLVNEIVVQTMELLHGQFQAAKVKTRIERGDNLPRVNGDSDRVQQVLINLVLNAVQAMPDGGSLVVSTRSITRARPGLEAEQSFVVLAVADNGVGIPADIRDKIFDPFYTTKEGQGGTGLGLAVCSGIVKEHDGWIDVEDGDAGGSVFRVYLPATR